MRRKQSPAVDDQAHLARLAWWISFFATLTVIAILGLARSAQALTVPAGLPLAAAATPVADEDFDDEAEASEDEELEFGDCDEEEEECDEADSSDGGAEAPTECVLSSVEASVFATGNHDQVRLQIRYTTVAPTTVTIDYGLHGGKGSLYLGSEKKHFGKKGVLRLTRSLTEPQMAKVMAARGFTVRLRVADAPRYCTALFDRQLDVRQATPAGLAWEQSE